ncbi:MAG: VOC family protein [Acidimicrobiia bacterium]
MARVSTYLNFMGDTEEAMRFYASVFGTEITEPIMRMADTPPMPGAPALTDAEQRLVMHMEITILAGHVLQATDMVASMGHTLTPGNNVTISLEPDTRAETERLFAALSEGGSDVMGLMDMFWGAQWGTCQDRYGIRWMFNCSEPAA